MNAHSFDTFPASGDATAPETGPFPFRPFLETIWRHRDEKTAELHTEVTPDGAVAFEVTDTMVRFAGQENLTDYHSPVGVNPGPVLETAFRNLSGHAFRFDSMPREAADAVANSLAAVGATFTETESEIAAVLSLPETTDEWLMGIGKKERHEVRRKRRKFEAEFGDIEVVPSGIEGLDSFVEMHRTSPGDKGEFMTPSMAAFFGDLVTGAGAVIHLLVCGGRPLAAAFGFETDAGYFYYNSALETDAAHASPGVVLFSTMIDTQIERGATVFDFLKGDERYKFRHGAEPRQLYALEGSLP